MIELLPMIFDRIRAGEKVALAIVVQTRGSSPQKAGAAMLVLESGQTLGTLGGGCVEAETRSRALTLLASGEQGVVLHSYSLNSDLGWDDGLLCGGQMKIAVETLGPTSDLQPLRQLATDLHARRIGTYAISEFTLTYSPTPRLVLAGAGHVAMALAMHARLAGFAVEVIDDRPEYVTADRFSNAKLHLGDIAETLQSLPLDPGTYIIIATRGHRNDAAALRAIISRPAAYKGLLGSKRKILTLLTELRTARVPVKALQEIRAPIGLAIGAITPEEIAISVLAELIAIRRGVTPPAALSLPADVIERHTA